MLHFGTLKDANTIARSPFLQSDEIRHRKTQPTIRETYQSWRLCQKRTTHANMATFGDLRPESCMDLLMMHLRASLFNHPGSMELILADRRNEYDPFILPWKPKANYLKLLREQGRLPEK